MIINKTLKQKQKQKLFHIEKIKFTSTGLTSKPKILNKINNQTTWLKIEKNNNNNRNSQQQKEQSAKEKLGFDYIPLLRWQGELSFFELLLSFFFLFFDDVWYFVMVKYLRERNEWFSLLYIHFLPFNFSRLSVREAEEKKYINK